MRGSKKILAAAFILSMITLHNSTVTSIIAEEDPFIEYRKYDENIVVNQELFSKNSFSQPLNGNILARTGNKYTGIYRGITSVNAGESDFYAFYDERHNNKFIRMANYNGTGALNTRLSVFYYDVENDTPVNMINTDHMNVSFSYRFYASDLDRLTLDDDTLILRYQSRGSANGRSGDVFAKNLIINEPGDDTWHTYSFKLSTTYSMTTEYGWFYFYYNNIAPSYDPTFYIDIDNLSVSLDDGINQVRGNGTFDLLVDDEKLNDSTKNSFIYPLMYYRKDYGLSAIQDSKDSQSYLRMNASGNKSTFSIEVNKQLIDEKLYIDFDYKDLSYYNKANLSLMINGKQGTVFEDIIGKEFIKDENSMKAITYEEAKQNGWINKKIIINGIKEKIETIDFVLECDCDLGIDNLYIADLNHLDSEIGNYQTFKKATDEVIEKLGDYKNKYTTNTLISLQKAINNVNIMNENSSNKRLDEALNQLNSAIDGLVEKGDIQLIKEYIDQIFDEMAGLNKNDFELKSYLRFKDALEKSLALSKNSTKSEVDLALAELKEKYNNLIRKEG